MPRQQTAVKLYNQLARMRLKLPQGLVTVWQCFGAASGSGVVLLFVVQKLYCFAILIN
jgi:hypothetical protein